jgi:hypothetical protein
MSGIDILWRIYNDWTLDFRKNPNKVLRMTTEAFLKEIEDFLAKTGMRHTTFGKEAMNDPSFVTRMRKGGNPTMKTIGRVREFIQQHGGKSASKCECAA